MKDKEKNKINFQRFEATTQKFSERPNRKIHENH